MAPGFSFLDDIFKREPKPAFGPERLDWISDAETQTRFSKANAMVQSEVAREELRHKDHVGTEKPFRVDVIRDPQTLVTYLDMTCEGCGAYKKLRVNERTGESEVVATTLIKAPKTYDAKDALAEVEKLEAERRKLQAARDQARRERERKDIEERRRRDLQRQIAERNAQIQFTAPPMRFLTSAMPFDPDYGDSRPLDAKPLRGKLVHKDKLGIERAPIDEEEV